MEWAPGDTWTLDTALPGGEYDFKFVVQRQDGSAGEWEPGANRTIKVSTSGAGSQSLFQVQAALWT
jgi:hypothetical protein